MTKLTKEANQALRLVEAQIYGAAHDGEVEELKKIIQRLLRLEKLATDSIQRVIESQDQAS